MRLRVLRGEKSTIIHQPSNIRKMKRGIRNNNPLNIRHSASQWQGAREEQTDPSFVQFESMAYGYRAAWKTLESYWHYFYRSKQPYTATTIIGRWAPPTENDTRNYIRTVLTLTSLGGKENLPQPSRGVDTERLERLIRAMTKNSFLITVIFFFGINDVKLWKKHYHIKFGW